MSEFKAVRDKNRPPIHPGAFFRDEVLPALEPSKTEIAKMLGISRNAFYEVIKEQVSVTPEMALRLGKLCGNGPDLWLNMQKRYDLWFAQQSMAKEIAKIPTLVAA